MPITDIWRGHKSDSDYSNLHDQNLSSYVFIKLFLSEHLTLIDLNLYKKKNGNNIFYDATTNKLEPPTIFLPVLRSGIWWLTYQTFPWKIYEGSGEHKLVLLNQGRLIRRNGLS